MAREDRQQRREVMSARQRAEGHESFERTTIKLPKDAQSFRVKSASVKRIDIIPYVVGAGNPQAGKGQLHYERTFFTHRDVGPNGDSYICLAKTFKQPCPICEYRARLARDPDADPDEIKGMAPKERQLFNVIDLGEPDKGIQVWDNSYHLFGKLLDERIKNSEPDEGWEFFHDPAQGFTLKLTFSERSLGKGKPFLEVSAIDFVERRKPLPDSIIDEAYCLDDLIIKPDYETLKKLFLQVDATDARDDAPANEPPAPRRRGAPPPEDAGDDPPPARRRGAPAAERDDPPPAGDDDWENTPPPARRRGAVAPPAEDNAVGDDGPPPAPRRRGVVPPEEPPDEPPPPSRRRGAPPPEDVGDDPPPARGRSRLYDDPPPDDDPPPAPRRRGAPPPEEEPADELPPPARRRRAE